MGKEVKFNVFYNFQILIIVCIFMLILDAYVIYFVKLHLSIYIGGIRRINE